MCTKRSVPEDDGTIHEVWYGMSNSFLSAADRLMYVCACVRT